MKDRRTDSVLRLAWQGGYEELGYERMGTLIVSSDIARELEEVSGVPLENSLVFGLLLRRDSDLPLAHAYVEPTLDF